MSAGAKLSAKSYAVETKPTLSTFIVVATEVVADGTEVLAIDINILEAPSQLNEVAEPVPVPKAKLFTVFATGVNPLSKSVPVYT